MIREVCTAVNEKLMATLSAMGVSPLPSFGVGKRALVDAGAPPRVTWVPTRGPHDGKGLGKGMGSNPRALSIRHLQIEAHVWGEDIDSTEELSRQLVAAIQSSGLATVFKSVGEVWDTESNTQAGELCIVTFEVELPLVDNALPTVRLTATGTEPGAAKIAIGPLEIIAPVAA